MLSVLIAALLLRLLYVAQALDYPLLFVAQLDEQYHLDWARALAGLDAGGVVFGDFMDPLYAWLLAGSLALFGDTTLPLRVLQILADCATAGLLLAIGTRLWSLRSGLVAGLLYALYPLAWFFAPTLLKATLTTFVVTFCVWLLVEALYRPHWARWAGLGALAGAAVFLRANLILLLPLIALVMLRHRRRLDGAGPAMVAYLAAAAALLVAGGLMNQATLGQFSILPSTGGSTFYSANHPGNPQGNYLPPVFVEANNPLKLAGDYRAEAERRTGTTMGPAEVSAYWRGEALRYLLSAPDLIPRLLLHKLAHLIGHTEIPNNHSIVLAGEYVPMLRLAAPAFALALGLGIPGLVIGLRREPRALALLVPVGVVVATALLYYSTARFRLPMVPMLLLGAGLLIDDAVRRGRRAWPALSAALLIGAVSLLIPAYPTDINPLRLNLAIAHARIGEPERAWQVLASTDARRCCADRYWQTVGEVALSQRDYGRALDAYGRVLPSRPDDVDLLHNAALAALRGGQPALALDWFGRAREHNPDAEYLYWQGEALRALGRVDEALAMFAAAVAEGTSGADYVVQAQAAAARLREVPAP